MKNTGKEIISNFKISCHVFFLKKKSKAKKFLSDYEELLLNSNSFVLILITASTI